ncbi:YmfQ family protein [Billgrantia gudaonensis]|uniref:Uncharacterized protein YmfQ in lambdoid prophage, DUF2313 family n=1 Tax=Billgrantia gudaonensis TaxID=376427 RepID=A0A1G9AYM1_9GAMM|nr:putative phage tail protein [Halomonas gudaonensis]SDK32411.1 Uncharacterized protein YmfQ in lambdoid prophage, DUF2313 family [Halomonas gudaonensis]
MALSRADYHAILHALAPPGRALPRDPETLWQRLLEARAGAFARLDGRADTLLEEADPRTAVDLLPDWERVTGLPDPCVTGEQTASERRDAVVRVLTGTGGASRSYFEGLAADLGYDVTVEDYTAHTVGSDVAEPLRGIDWRWAWTVRGPEQSVRYFDVDGTVDEALATWGNERLECVISRLKPAHTLVLFAYGEQ